MSSTDANIASALAPAGLRFLGQMQGHVRDPLPPSRSAASCAQEHGRFDCHPEEIVDVDDPGLPTKVNAAWWRMATEYGLLVDYRDSDAGDPDLKWVKVRLLDDWDLAGSGVAVLQSYFAGLFTDRFVPEFTMLSRDGRALLNTTVWGNGTVSTIVIRPDRLRNQ